MRIHNVHERTLPMPADEAGRLLDSLASPDDRLWPGRRWPPMRFDTPGLVVGAVGGHGPVRYTVQAYEPGREARFRFRGMAGIEGEHAFSISRVGDDRSVLRHVMIADARGASIAVWKLLVERLHDACVEDCMDRAEGVAPRGHDPLVRLARALMRARGSSRTPWRGPLASVLGAGRRSCSQPAANRYTEPLSDTM